MVKFCCELFHCMEILTIDKVIEQLRVSGIWKQFIYQINRYFFIYFVMYFFLIFNLFVCWD